MQRRGFLQRLSGIVLAPLGLWLAKPAIATRCSIILECRIAGFHYHHGPALWKRLTEGDPLSLHRERDNPHDRRAVALHWRGRRIGYVPRNVNRAIARLLDEGRSLEARIDRLYADETWEPLRFQVSLQEGNSA